MSINIEQYTNLIEDREAFKSGFPLPPRLETAYTLAGKHAFVDAFIPVRDAVESAYYAQEDQKTTKSERTRKFLAAMIDPVLGKPMRDAEHFYQTYGRLMRHAWLSISVGLYNAEIQRVQDVHQRLILAQVNNVDTNWRPAVSHISNNLNGKGLIVEVGTGRGNSALRLATLLPETRIVTITISPEQHAIVSAIVGEMGLNNVEVRCGDLFDPAVMEDLIGQADAAGAIEVVLHFAKARKLEGMKMLTRLLKPNSPLCIIDSSIEKTMSAFSDRYYANQSIYFGQRQDYFDLFEDAGLEPRAYVDYTPDMNQAFRETTQVLRKFRPQLKDEFGTLMSWLWPEIPGSVYIKTLENIRYIHAVGMKV
jgi:cyclopropane fatty-acyl-phospholipid synthase-like methyltransferase